MSGHSVPDQITYRYRKTDSVAGITCATAKRFAGLPGVTKTRLIHNARSERDSTPQSPYEPDDGPLTTAQMREIENAVPQGIKRPIRSSLFELDITWPPGAYGRNSNPKCKIEIAMQYGSRL